VRRSPRSGARISWDLVRSYTESGVPLLAVATMNMFTSWGGTLVVGMFSPPQEVGIYHVASRVAMFTGFVLIGVNSVMGPRYARLIREGNVCELESLARTATLLGIVVTAPLFVAVFTFPGALMTLFGPEFESGAVVLVAISIGQVVNTVTGSVTNILAMGNQEKILRNAVLLSGGVGVTLLFALAPSYGALGAAFALSTALVVRNAMLVLAVRGRLNIMTIPFFRRLSKSAPE